MLERRGVIDTTAEPALIDDIGAERDRALSALAAASVTGHAPAGPERRKGPPIALRADTSLRFSFALSATQAGFSLHAATTAAAGREALCKYVLRPPLAQDRESLGVPFAVSDHFARGGEGAVELARAVIAHAEKTPRPFAPLYDWKAPVVDKIRTVAQKMYGASAIRLTNEATRDLADVERLGYAGLPSCIAKTQSSLSDDPSHRGRPRDFEVSVRRIQINAWRGLLGRAHRRHRAHARLARKPNAEHMDLVDGRIVGLH